MTEDLYIETDDDGYPMEESLEKIEKFVPDESFFEKKEEIVSRVLDEIVRVWKYEGWAKGKDGLYVFATGGWSGNQDLMSAFFHSEFRYFVDYVHLGAGFFAIAATDKAKNVLNRAIHRLIKSLWNYVRNSSKKGGQNEP
jgi:hypothetical protein